MTGIRIVDVCGTLVRDDTTLGLLQWHFARSRRWRLWGLRLLAGRWSPGRVGIAVLERVTGRHLLKLVLVRWLKGDAVTDLEASANEYADWLLDRRRVRSVSDLLASSHEPLVLASASLEPVVRALADRLGASFVASTLAMQSGHYLGCYDDDITGRKLEALAAKFGDRLENGFVAVSDNITDRALLERARHAFVVLHKPQHAARWHGLKAEYIDLC